MIGEVSINDSTIEFLEDTLKLNTFKSSKPPQTCFTHNQATFTYEIDYLNRTTQRHYRYDDVSSLQSITGVYRYCICVDKKTSEFKLYVSSVVSIYDAIDDIYDITRYICSSLDENQRLVMFGELETIDSMQDDDFEGDVRFNVSTKLSRHYKKMPIDIFVQILQSFPSLRKSRIQPINEQLVKISEYDIDINHIPAWLHVTESRSGCKAFETIEQPTKIRDFTKDKNQCEDIIAKSDDHYEILGSTISNSKKEIRKNWKKLNLVYHPDKRTKLKGVSNDTANTCAQKINNAIDVIENQKNEYDHTKAFKESKSFFKQRKAQELENKNIHANIFCNRISVASTNSIRIHNIACRLLNQTGMSDVLLTEINPLGKSGLFGTIFKCNATFQLGDKPITKLIAFKVALPVGDYVVQNEHRSVQFKREIMMQRFAADALLAPEVHFSLILDGDVKGALNTAFEQMFGTRSQFVRAYKNAECVMLVGMQVVEGLNLHDIKDSARRQKYARIALKKIQNLHDIGIVHGDAHLGNVMVEDKTDKVFLLDYGIANSIIYTPNFSYGSYQGHVQGFVNVKNRENLWLYERQEPISQLIHAANFSNPDPKFAHVGSKITSKPESKLPNYHSILKSPSQVGGGRRTNSTRRRSKKLKMTKRRRVGGFGKLQFWTGQFYGRST